MTVEKYFMINLYDRTVPTWQGLNQQPPDHQSDAHPTEPLSLATFLSDALVYEI